MTRWLWTDEQASLRVLWIWDRCFLPSNSTYPSVNVYITMENHNLFMGKSTISTGPFSSSQTVNVYQRIYFIIIPGLSHHPMVIPIKAPYYSWYFPIKSAVWNVDDTRSCVWSSWPHVARSLITDAEGRGIKSPSMGRTFQVYCTCKPTLQTS